MFSFPYVNILTWADILFEKLRPEIGEFEKHTWNYLILLYRGAEPSAILSELPIKILKFYRNFFLLKPHKYLAGLGKNQRLDQFFFLDLLLY